MSADSRAHLVGSPQMGGRLRSQGCSESPTGVQTIVSLTPSLLTHSSLLPSLPPPLPFFRKHRAQEDRGKPHSRAFNPVQQLYTVVLDPDVFLGGQDGLECYRIVHG